MKIMNLQALYQATLKYEEFTYLTGLLYLRFLEGSSHMLTKCCQMVILLNTELGSL